MIDWPSNSVQGWVGGWWEEKKPAVIERGRLVWVYLPHVDQQPMLLVPEGRSDPTDHSTFTYRIKPFDIGRPLAPPRLPVASIPDSHEEPRQVFRTKKRPALIICQGGLEIPKEFKTGGMKKLRATCLVAPYYGGDKSGTRGGFPKGFIERARKAEWPQFIWDMLPNSVSTNESILRLDHIQPIPRENNSIQCTSYCLNKEALLLIDDWIHWLLTGIFPEKSFLLELREELLNA